MKNILKPFKYFAVFSLFSACLLTGAQESFADSCAGSAGEKSEDHEHLPGEIVETESGQKIKVYSTKSSKALRDTSKAISQGSDAEFIAIPEVEIEQKRKLSDTDSFDGRKKGR